MPAFIWPLAKFILIILGFGAVTGWIVGKSMERQVTNN